MHIPSQWICSLAVPCFTEWQFFLEASFILYVEVCSEPQQGREVLCMRLGFVCLPVKCLCDVLCCVVLVLCHVHRACQASPQLLPYTAIRSSPSRFVNDIHTYSVRSAISIRVSKNHPWAFPASSPIANWRSQAPGTSGVPVRSDLV